MLLPSLRAHDMHEDVLDVARVSAVVGEQHGDTTDAEQVGDQHGLEVPKVLVLGDVLRADHDRVRVVYVLRCSSMSRARSTAMMRVLQPILPRSNLLFEV
jgi:hypothetical protein